LKPPSARAMSAATEGFSAMISCFAMHYASVVGQKSAR
jgi:hypothetical protein